MQSDPTQTTDLDISREARMMTLQDLFEMACPIGSIIFLSMLMTMGIWKVVELLVG